MVEGAHIDKTSTVNDMNGMLAYLDEFDNAIEAVSAKMNDKDNYSMIVTADHECGGLKYNGESKDQINDSLFTVKNHTKADVSYYVRAKYKKVQNPSLPANIDNTDIFKMCYSLISNKK